MNLARDDLALLPSMAVRRLSVIACVLVLASIAGQVAKFFFGHDQLLGLVALFSVDEEQNVPSFFSMTLLLIAAALLALIAIVESRQQSGLRGKWWVLCAGFELMAYDEICQAHEALYYPMESLTTGRDTGVFEYGLWLIPGSALVVLLGLFFWNFLIGLPAATRRNFIIAATLYLGGAMGVELIGAIYVKNHPLDFTYSLMATCEEGLEMAGVIYFIRSLLEYLARHHAALAIRFE